MQREVLSRSQQSEAPAGSGLGKTVFQRVEARAEKKEVAKSGRGCQKVESQNAGCSGKLNRHVGQDPERSREREVGVLNARGCLSNAVHGRKADGKVWRAHTWDSEARAREGMRIQQQVASRPGKQGPSPLTLGWEEGASM